MDTTCPRCGHQDCIVVNDVMLREASDYEPERHQIDLYCEQCDRIRRDIYTVDLGDI